MRVLGVQRDLWIVIDQVVFLRKINSTPGLRLRGVRVVMLDWAFEYLRAIKAEAQHILRISSPSLPWFSSARASAC